MYYLFFGGLTFFTHKPNLQTPPPLKPDRSTCHYKYEFDLIWKLLLQFTIFYFTLSPLGWPLGETRLTLCLDTHSCGSVKVCVSFPIFFCPVFIFIWRAVDVTFFELTWTQSSTLAPPPSGVWVNIDINPWLAPIFSPPRRWTRSRTTFKMLWYGARRRGVKCGFPLWMLCINMFMEGTSRPPLVSQCQGDGNKLTSDLDVFGVSREALKEQTYFFGSPRWLRGGGGRGGLLSLAGCPAFFNALLHFFNTLHSAKFPLRSTNQ